MSGSNINSARNRIDKLIRALDRLTDRDIENILEYYSIEEFEMIIDEIERMIKSK